MLTTVEQVLQWFTDFGGTTNPYWSLYAGLEKRDATQRRGFNWETADFEKSKALLKSTLERYATAGGAYNMAVGDKPRDNNPSAGTPILLTPTGQSQNGAVAMINGVPVPFNNGTSVQNVTADTIALHVQNAQLSMRLEMEKNERERDKREAASIGGGLVGWLQGLSNHPQFDPNTPFNMISGLLGTVLGVPNMAANPQGLPVQVGFNYGQQQQPQKPTAQPVEQPKAAEPPTEQPPTDVKFTYDVQQIAMNYHNLCENMGIELNDRNGFLTALNESISKMSPLEKMQLAQSFTAKAA